ncbi:MAG TPA: class I SAM-dependent methyltransferase [Polyangiaceae bacterium]|nr:class I SAM-dependent methyltransferase [Polyangiaceae bacterium]
MTTSIKSSEQNSREYYDEFAKVYDDRRGNSVPFGYHDLLDELETSLVERFGSQRDILEVGCGTGLIMQRVAKFARRVHGVDLSPGMLAHAQARGLDVTQGSATQLPFSDGEFDVTYSFKVLAHVPDIELALSEMARVTRPGGMILAEFYNPYSIRGLLRHLGPAKQIGQSKKEADVFTRFDSPSRARALTPRGCHFEGARGIRIVTPAAQLIDMKGIGRLFYATERLLADSPLSVCAGFYVAQYRKAERDAEK